MSWMFFLARFLIMLSIFFDFSYLVAMVLSIMN